MPAGSYQFADSEQFWSEGTGFRGEAVSDSEIEEGRRTSMFQIVRNTMEDEEAKEHVACTETRQEQQCLRACQEIGTLQREASSLL
jgi:hypothetical protein